MHRQQEIRPDALDKYNVKGVFTHVRKKIGYTNKR